MLSLARTKKPLAAVAMLAFALPLAGCPDPDGKLDDFAERKEKEPPPVVGACGSEVTQTPSGEYLFVLSAGLSPKKPILFHATVESDTEGFSMRLHALTAKDRKTLVGDPIEVGPFPINDKGEFTAALPPDLNIDGAANGITGSDIVATVVLEGTMCTDFVCGAAKGAVTKPIKLTLEPTSFFTMEPVGEGGEYPEPPVINCEREEAEPLP